MLALLLKASPLLARERGPQPSAWKGNSANFALTEFSEVALVPAEYPNRRHYQDHPQHELECRRRDYSDEEASCHSLDHRPHPHRGDRLRKVGTLREGA